MSKKKRRLRALLGSDVVRIFVALGFEVVSQKGSHIKLRRVLPTGEKQILGLPNHKIIAIGTLKAIYNQATRYVDEEVLDKHFRVRL